MLCIQGSELAKIETALDELLDNRIEDYLHPDDRTMLEEARKACKDVHQHTATEEERDAAHGLYANDELEIDDEASTSRADDGYWVSAWVWVPNDEEEDEDEEQ